MRRQRNKGRILAKVYIEKMVKKAKDIELRRARVRSIL